MKNSKSLIPDLKELWTSDAGFSPMDAFSLFVRSHHDEPEDCHCHQSGCYIYTRFWRSERAFPELGYLDIFFTLSHHGRFPE